MRSVALLLVVLASIIAVSSGFWAQEPTGGEIRDQILRHRESLCDYSATLQVIKYTDASSGKIFVQVEDPYRYRFERMGADGKPDLLEIFNGSVLWLYRPGTGETELIAAGEAAFDRLVREDYQQVIPRIVEENAIAYLGVEGVNGSRAHVIEASPGNPIRYMGIGFTRMRAWIDASTWMVDKAAFYNEAGNSVLSVEYTNLAVNRGIPKNTFTPPRDAASESQALIPVIFPRGAPSP
ncbi:hypothetical protein ABH15_05395 [Methanoculleus taiwanensis]|uniref:Uncharacterized protein TP-0789 domain-containing protein n=1 Tax=Methanoculleus taiwanensis TaxID=1550565 RepID=A0A498GZW9_9EURY|nr:outer membrane lipoprotein-sorting protein [Methanoculleus taiwanensis]RXE55677.1 hypothetical protein ABH15_05395 [Methanoculleus taiwanensis]